MTTDTYSSDYFTAAAKAMLGAKREILIASWKNSPRTLLTRPPLPPIRMDQILAYKAAQGVKIYILLYKEVELSGQGNDSGIAMDYLQSLHRNIQVIRHPNKIVGGSTAIMWSHHEKLLVVDRQISFVGGIDLAVGRWDNESHSVVDEDGILYTGNDYRQPAVKLHQSAVPQVAIRAPKRSSKIDMVEEFLGDAIDAWEEMKSSRASTATSTSTSSSSQKPKSPEEEEEENARKRKTNLLSDHLLHDHEIRDMYPRSGWHDCQSSVSGLAARDVAAHFVQRWQHHKLSTNDSRGFDENMTFMTSDPNYGICAKCGMEDIWETDLLCSSCGHDLGPISPYLVSNKLEEQGNSDTYMPVRKQQLTFIEFEVETSEPLNVYIYGDAPSVVLGANKNINVTTPTTTPSPSPRASQHSVDSAVNEESRLVSSFGEKGFIDILISKGLKVQSGDIIISIDGKPVNHLNVEQLKRILARQKEDHPHIKYAIRRHWTDSMGGGAKIQSSQNPIHLMSTTGISNLEFSSQFHSCVNAINMDWNPNISLQHMASNFFFGKDIDLKAQFKDSWHHCKLKAVSECALQMSQVFYESSRFNVKPLAKMATNSGSCNVQILRSSASWSLGLNKPDCSIMNAWCDAITNSERLVYIENQFFIGSVMRNKADNPRNSVPAAILERVVKAAKLGEKFKCVIIIPQHPQGDIAFKQTPRIILHYQSETINRGINSIFSQFKQQCPGIDPSKYIGFYCLQNWGILNGQFVHNQVYVHDKMCVIDDRIMIVGSANINDRSMLGERDSEVAIRIEDTNLLTIGKSPDEYKVGSVPHEVRCRLMRQHIGDKEGTKDVSDPITSDFLDQVSAKNAEMYSLIDKDRDVYNEKCPNLTSYQNAVLAYSNPLVDEPHVQKAMKEISGNLVPWPLTFLKNEDLSPSLATRAIVPTNLWV